MSIKIPYLTSSMWKNIVSYMDDDTREQVHCELAPCTEYEFLTRYLELDDDFYIVLDEEFSNFDYTFPFEIVSTERWNVLFMQRKIFGSVNNHVTD